jgi:hypothetical protein
MSTSTSASTSAGNVQPQSKHTAGKHNASTLRAYKQNEGGTGLCIDHSGDACNMLTRKPVSSFGRQNGYRWIELDEDIKISVRTPHKALTTLYNVHL